MVEPLPSPPGAPAEAEGGCDAPPGVKDGDGAMGGAGGEPGVAGAGADVVGEGGEAGVPAGAGIGAAPPEGGGDDGLSAGAAAGGGVEDGLGRGAADGGDMVGGAPGGVRSARTTTMSFSLARQLDSLPLMKKKGPEWSNVNTVLPSSNLFTYDVTLHALYAAGSTRSTESVSFGYTNTARTSYSTRSG